MNDLRERYDFLFDGSGDLTQETLLLYVFGPLENGARDAVEQHVEQCEMCRDAAEGMALLGTKEQALAALAMADERLLERVELLKQKVTSSGREALIDKTAATDPVVLKVEKPVRSMVWYRYAAAASVLVAIGVAFWFVNDSLNKELSPLSMNQEDTLVLDKVQPSLEPKKALEEEEELSLESGLANDTISINVSGSAATYGSARPSEVSSGEAPSPFTATGSSHANGGAPVTDGAAPSVTIAKPAAPSEAPGYMADEEVVYADNLEEVAMAPPAAAAKSKAPASDDAKKKREPEDWEKSTNRTASRKDAPALDKGTGNTNFSQSNISNMGLAYQLPPGEYQVTSRFTQQTWPKAIRALWCLK